MSRFPSSTAFFWMLFWDAFVLTQPFGATIGDVLTKTHEKGDLGYETIGASIVLGSILGVCILFTTLKQTTQDLARLSSK